MTRGGDETSKSGEGAQAQDVLVGDAGVNPAAVVEVVRTMTGVELSPAELVARVPHPVRTRIAPALAEALRARLVAAGARVEVRPHVESERFDVVLLDHGSSKIGVIRAVKMVAGLELKEAIELVDDAPAVVVRKVDQAEAETIRHELSEAGARVEIRRHDPSTAEPARASAISSARGSAPEPTEPGVFEVILQQCGPNKIHVIKVIRTATGLGLKDSKDLAESTNVAVKRDLPSHEAMALQRELMAAGAAVEVRAQDEAPPPAAPSTAATVDIILRECGPRKIMVIKLIRELTYLGLKEAKDLSESPGSTVKSGVARDEAERIERQFVEAGAVIELRPSGGAAATAESAPAGGVSDASMPLLVDVFLWSFGLNKILTIKEVRALTGLGLKDAKDLVEAAPCLVKAQVDRAVAEQFKRTLAEFGATVDLRE